jgi:hypothetical protein
MVSKSLSRAAWGMVVTLGVWATAAQAQTTAAPAATDSKSSASSVFLPTQNVQGTNLVLNGWGTRTKFFMKVYDLGLYITTKAKTADEVIAQAGPKKLSFIARREVSGSELGLGFVKGVTSNATPEQVRKYSAVNNRLVEIFSGKHKMFPGESFAMEFVPGKGTTFYIKGEAQGTPVGDDEYFGMVLRVWLGQSPADKNLKEALLGAN